MSGRTDYQREYMRKRRALERDARRAGDPPQGFTEAQIRGIVREELGAMLTPANVNALLTEFTVNTDPANVNSVDTELTGLAVNSVDRTNVNTRDRACLLAVRAEAGAMQALLSEPPPAPKLFDAYPLPEGEGEGQPTPRQSPCGPNRWKAPRHWKRMHRPGRGFARSAEPRWRHKKRGCAVNPPA
jgi:hypothetical protein